MSESTLPDTCTLLLSLELDTFRTFNPRTNMVTEVTESTVHLALSDNIETHTVETEIVLGQGGMGIVKSGQQRYPEREVAIKKVLGTPMPTKECYFKRHRLQDN